MGYRVSRRSRRPAALWANGQGRSEVVFSEPASDRWVWRLSVAEIATDSRFSVFENVDRLLVPLQDDVRLEMDGTEKTVSRGQVERFRGELDVRAVGVASPRSVLNLMTRRGLVVADLEVVEHAGTLAGDGRELVAYVIDGTARLSARVTLSAGDACRVIGHSAIAVDGVVALARIRPVGRAQHGL